MTLPEKYSSYLLAVRSDPSLIRFLTFDQDAKIKQGNAIDRLRVASALFNDLQVGDYGLVRSLFVEELKMKKKYRRQHSNLGLQLLGFLLAQFKNQDDIWLLFEAYRLDKAFAIERVLSIGIARVFYYLHTGKPKDRMQLMKLIGRSSQKLKYTQTQIDYWIEDEAERFKLWKFPLQNELYFAGIMEEKERVKELLPHWVSAQTEWTFDNLSKYLYYAQEFSEDIHTEIHALELYTSHMTHVRVEEYYTYLVGLYLKCDHYQDKAIALIKTILNDKPGKELVAKCVEQLCTIILKNKDVQNSHSQEAYSLLQKHDKKNSTLPLALKKLVGKAVRIMGSMG